MKQTDMPINSDNVVNSEYQSEIIHQKQLYAVQQKAADDHRALISVYTDREQKLRQELSQVHQVLVDKESAFKNLCQKICDKHQAELAQLLRSLAQRELIAKDKSTDDQAIRACNNNLCAEQFESLHTLLQEYEQREKMLRIEQCNLLKSLADHEKKFGEQVLAAEQEKFDLICAYTEKNEKLHQTFNHHKTELLQKQWAMQARSTEREREFRKQLEAFHQLAAQEKAELSNRYSEKIIATEQEHAVRIKELLQEQLAMQACSAEREKILNDQIQTRHQEAAVLEAQLRQQLQQKEQQAHCLRSALEQASGELRSIHASFSWWLTAPLRLFNPLSTTTDFSITSESITYQLLPQVCTSLVPKDTNMNSNTQSGFTIIPAKTVDELLRNFDAAFVHGVYVTLLGREPDPTGMSYYLARLRSGYGKAELVAQIALSKEGRSRNVNILGLEDLLVQQQRESHWFWRIFNRGRRLEYQCNRLEYTLDNMVNRLNGVESSVNAMSRSIEVFKNMSVLSQSEVALELKLNSNGTTVSEASDKGASEQELEKLSASEKNIYVKLLEARKGNEG